MAQAWLGMALLCLVLLLAGCAGGGSSLEGGGPGEPRGKTVPPVAFGQVTGLPPGKLAELRSAMAVAGGERDIGIVEGEFQSGSFALSGQFRTSADSTGVRVVYRWEFRDADGVLIDTIDGEDNAGVPTGVDPWATVTAAVLQRIAKRTAEQMAQKLAAMGYATRLSRLFDPPADYFAKADWNAHREIDFETLNGPGMAFVGMDQVAPPDDAVLAAAAPVEPVPGEAEMAANPPPQETRTAATEPPDGKTDRETGPPAAEGKMEIRAVAVIPVVGSPGTGNAELTTAMRKTLKSAGWPVVNRPQRDALTVVGKVKVADKDPKNQTVSIQWLVQTPDGRTLGDVKQANDLPKGALDAGWGQAAFAVTEAAATGIFDIVKKFR